MHAFKILQYAFGIPRAFVLISTKETSEREANASPLKPKLSLFLSVSARRELLDVAVKTQDKQSIEYQIVR